VLTGGLQAGQDSRGEVCEEKGSKSSADKGRTSKHHRIAIAQLAGVNPLMLGVVPIMRSCWESDNAVREVLPNLKSKVHL